MKPEGKKNEIISSAENSPDIEEKHNGNNNNITIFKGERWLEGKFVSSNVINLSKEISLKLKSSSCLRV